MREDADKAADGVSGLARRLADWRPVIRQAGAHGLTIVPLFTHFAKDPTEALAPLDRNPSEETAEN